MPAAVRRSEIAHVCTEMTSLFGYSTRGGANYGIQGDYRAVHRLFDHLHRPMDVVTEYGFTDAIKRRKVLVAGHHATVASKGMVDEVKAFLSRGGVAIFSGEAFRYDYDTFHSGAESPIAGLSDVLKADMAKANDFLSSDPLVVADASLTPGLKKGDDVLPAGKRWLTTMPVTGGCVVIATAGGKPVVVASPDGKMLYVGVRLLGTCYRGAVPKEANLRKLIEAFVRRSGSVPPVEVTGGDDAFQVRTSVLEGNGCYLVELSNAAPRDQEIEVDLGFLGAGRWELADVTGETPIVEKNARNEFHLKPDRMGRRAWRRVISPKDTQVLNLDARRSTVWMIRPAYQEVWQLMPDYTVKALCRLPVSVVLPDAAEEYEKQAAEDIRKLLTAWGTDVKVVAASDVKTKRETKPITWKEYALETFSGNRFDVDCNLIVIGEASRNAVTRKLYADDTFTMDKVILRTDAKLPGAGKGVIQLVESLNALVYDWTDKSADAIVITGSDAAGVRKAIERFMMVLWQ